MSRSSPLRNSELVKAQRPNNEGRKQNQVRTEWYTNFLECLSKDRRLWFENGKGNVHEPRDSLPIVDQGVTQQLKTAIDKKLQI